MSRYIGLIHAGEGLQSWGISFPDFPGCISGADDFLDVVDAGTQALRFHVEGMIEDGQAIPPPREYRELRDDPEFAADFEDAIVTVVTLLPPRAKPMRVNVSLDANLLLEIDAAARIVGMNRSEFLAEGARRLIVQPTAVEVRVGTIGAAVTPSAPPKVRGRGRILRDPRTGEIITRGHRSTKPAESKKR